MSNTVKKFAIVLVMSLAAVSTLNASAQTRIELNFAAAPTDSPWYAYAGALRSAMLTGLPTGSTIDVLNTPMAIANLKLITAAKADIGLSFSPVARWAQQGFGPFNEPTDNLRGLIGGMDEYFNRVTVQLDSPIQSIADIKKNRIPVHIGTGPMGSLNEYMARLTLAAYGLTYQDIESYGGSVMRTSFNVLSNLYGDHKIDMILGITMNGHTNTTQLAIAPGQKFLDLNDEAVSYLEKFGFSAATIPANMFKRQGQPVHGVGFSTSLYARVNLSDETTYAITKAVMENRETLKKQFGSMTSWSAEDSGKEQRLGVPLHPGARKYFEESGLLK